MKHEADKPFLKILNVLLVNLLWFVFSLPIITIGPATCSAFYLIIKICNNKEVSTFKMFTKGMKDNALQGLIMSLISAVSAAMLFGIWYLVFENEWFNIIALGVALVLSMTIVNSNVFAYAFIGRYENTFVNIVKNVVVRQLQFFKRAALIFLIVTVELGVLGYLFYLNILGGIIGFFFWPGFIIYSVCLIMLEIFRQIEENQ